MAAVLWPRTCVGCRPLHGIKPSIIVQDNLILMRVHRQQRRVAEVWLCMKWKQWIQISAYFPSWLWSSSWAHCTKQAEQFSGSECLNTCQKTQSGSSACGGSDRWENHPGGRKCAEEHDQDLCTDSKYVDFTHYFPVHRKPRISCILQIIVI